MDSEVDSGPKSKRHSKSCQRCQRRKQRCHGFPICSNCQVAKKTCVQSEYSIELHRSSSEYAAFERIKQLEEQLAAALSQVSRQSEIRVSNDGIESQDSSLAATLSNNAPIHSTHATDEAASTRPDIPIPNDSQELGHTSSGGGDSHQIADTVGFLSLGDSLSGNPAYVGPSSGISLATNLGDLMRATVWRKALASSVSDSQTKSLSVTDLTNNQCGPPSNEIASKIMKAYFVKVHQRYPFMDRRDILKLHARRHQKTGSTPQEQYGTFKLYMIYAIGSTLLQLTEPYNDTSPEKYFITAMQFIASTRDSHPIHHLESMLLLVLYNLRSPSNSGIWYFIGLAMRTAIDLGLHREAHYATLSAFHSQLRRRLFWSVYLLDRVVAISLGRPVNIADQDIDVDLPLDIDDNIHDDSVIAQLLAKSRQPNAPRQITTLTMWTELVKLKRIESHIQSQIYRVDKPVSSLLPEVRPLLLKLEQWRASVPKLTAAETHSLDLIWNKAIRLLIQPFINILSPQDDLLGKCLISSGQICQIFKQMFQQDSYGHSFISVHSIFIAGVTICYCLCLHPSLWTTVVANDLRACSSALFVMAERTPNVRRYRDVLETVISSALDFVAKSSTSSDPSRQEGDVQSNITSHEHQAVQSLLGLSSQSQNANQGFSTPPQPQVPQILPEDSVVWGQAPTQIPSFYREEVSNWTIQEPMFDLQWQDGEDFSGEMTENTPLEAWPELPDLSVPPDGEKESVWTGDRFGLHMINTLLSMESTGADVI